MMLYTRTKNKNKTKTTTMSCFRTFDGDDDHKSGVVSASLGAPTFFYSSYTGKVVAKAAAIGGGQVALAGMSEGIAVKVIDAKKYRLNPDVEYPIKSLEQLPAQVVHVNDNVMAFYYTMRLRNIQDSSFDHTKHISSLSVPTPEQQRVFCQKYNIDNNLLTRVLSTGSVASMDKLYNSVIAVNAGVDCLFNGQEMMIFLKEVFGHSGVGTPNNTLIVVNGADVDNAYFTGEYLVIGGGRSLFNSMAAPDVMAHEGGHGVVMKLANLVYQGESGALNEHFADVIGVVYEFWLYRKYNANDNPNDDLIGESDWVLGEDEKRTMPWLRNFEDPTNAKMPQPKYYKGQHWEFGSRDNGGVHINSGVPNHCFFLAATSPYGLMSAAQLWYKCLTNLKSRSNMSDFARELMSLSGNNQHIQQALFGVGLWKTAPTPAPDTKPQPDPTPTPDTKPKPDPKPSTDVILLPKFAEQMVMVPKPLWDILIANQKTAVTPNTTNTTTSTSTGDNNNDNSTATTTDVTDVIATNVTDDEENTLP
jgi:hypothetical protein